MLRWLTAFVFVAGVEGCDTGGPGEAERNLLVAERGTEFGEAEGDGVLSSVFDVDVSPEGEVFASEPQYGHVLVFAPDGSYRRTIGRMGNGPGEMQVPGALWWLGDTLVVMDFRVGAHLFGRDGAFFDRVDFRLTAPDSPFPVRPMFPLADGSLGAMAPLPSSVITSGTVTHQTWLKVTREGEVLDTLLLEPLAGRLVQLEVGGDPRSISHPLPWNPLLAVPPDGSFILWVDRKPDAAEPRLSVTRLSVDGDTLSTRAIPYRPVALGAGEIDSLAAEMASSSAGSMGMTEDRAAEMIRDQVPWPEHLPPVTAAVAGSDGTVWLRREELSDSVRWDILDGDLAEIGSVFLPAEYEPKALAPEHRAHEKRWSVYGVELTALDVPRIVQYAVRQGG